VVRKAATAHWRHLWHSRSWLCSWVSGKTVHFEIGVIWENLRGGLNRFMLTEKLTTHIFVLRAILAAVMIVLAAVLRIVPHPWNFTPIGAMALFAGAMFRDRRVAFLFPLAALFAGDLFVGLHRLIPVVYASFLVSVLIGIWLANHRSILRIGGAVFLGALQFFLVTNLAVWQLFGTYPHTPSGLAACYIAGLPFFGNALAGDAVYATLFFGIFALADHLFPTLRLQPNHLTFLANHARP
jgi:uncharacterized membrane protein